MSDEFLNLDKDTLDALFRDSIEPAKLAIEKCISTEGIQSVTVPYRHEGGILRVKATKRLTSDDKMFYGEILVTIGPPTWNEKQRMANMKRHGKIPQFFFRMIGKSTRKKEEYFF